MHGQAFLPLLIAHLTVLLLWTLWSLLLCTHGQPLSVSSLLLREDALFKALSGIPHTILSLIRGTPRSLNLHVFTLVKFSKILIDGVMWPLRACKKRMMLIHCVRLRATVCLKFSHDNIQFHIGRVPIVVLFKLEGVIQFQSFFASNMKE